MIASGSIGALTERHPAKFSTPDHQCFVQQATLFQIGQQSGNRLIHLRAMPAMVLFDALMRVPCFFQMSTTGIQLHEANSAFHKATSHEAVATKLVGWLPPDSIQLLCGLRFLAEIHSLRGLRLHSIGQFVGRNPCRQFVTPLTNRKMLLVQLSQQIQLSPLDVVRHP